MRPCEEIRWARLVKRQFEKPNHCSLKCSVAMGGAGEDIGERNDETEK
jgi:hypothetical protein